MPALFESVSGPAFGFASRLPEYIAESTRLQLGEPEIVSSDGEVQTALRNTTQRGAEMLVHGVQSLTAATTEQRAHGAPFARVAARHDIPLTTVLQCYRISHAAAVDHLLAHAIEVGAPLPLVRQAVRNIFFFVEGLTEIGSRAYVAERQRINSQPGRAKYLRIRSVLDGAASLEMSYPLHGPHVALVLRSPQPASTFAAIENSVPRSALLVCDAPDGRVWVWVSTDQTEAVIEALRTAGHGPLLAGVSGPEHGIEGFRSANRKAQIALRLGARGGRRVTTFADVALEALALGRQELAWEFVRSEMGALAELDPRTTVIRDTVSAYFASGTAPTAAEALQVSTRTVVYRLRHAERILGRPLTSRRAELETAIRLQRLLLRSGAPAVKGLLT